MNPLADLPKLSRLFRMQWEEAQNAHVLLYPEGMVKLNQSAAEILKRCEVIPMSLPSSRNWRQHSPKPV